MTAADAPAYELFYWPTIPGRGELIRLAFEDAGVAYVDVARRPEAEGGGVKAMMARMRAADPEPFAPPFLVHGALVVAQTANVLQYLGPRLGLVPDDEASRLRAHQLQLTLADLIEELHGVHHPIDSSLYYEDQRAEAKRYAAAFLRDRLPKHLGWLARVLRRAGGEHLVGGAVSYVDLSVFQIVAGLDYAFPSAMKKLPADLLEPLRALHDRIAKRPRIAAYLRSPRRLPFNEQGLFRRYPELDV
ncbi:MAG: glutathione S-transferase [Polyangiales bacterium]